MAVKKIKTLQTNTPTQKWTFLTNHAHVLICLSRDEEVRIRDLSDLVGVTERTVQLILTDLENDGFVQITKEGRRNKYSVMKNLPLRHPVEAHRTVKDLLQLVK